MTVAEHGVNNIKRYIIISIRFILPLYLRRPHHCVNGSFIFYFLLLNFSFFRFVCSSFGTRPRDRLEFAFSRSPHHD
jgi:hypothetical protein